MTKEEAYVHYNNMYFADFYSSEKQALPKLSMEEVCKISMNMVQIITDLDFDEKNSAFISEYICNNKDCFRTTRNNLICEHCGSVDISKKFFRNLPKAVYND